MRHALAFFATVTLFSAPAFAEEIKETLASPLRAELVSKKNPSDLEVCVADAITQIGGAVPVPLRNGGENVMMLGYGHTPKLIVLLDKIGSGTRIRIHTKSGDMDGKFVRSLQEACTDLTVIKAPE